MKITTLDTHWTGRPQSIAAALVEDGSMRAVIDPGPASTIATLKQKLEGAGLAVADLDAIFLTHIHLDHAAAAGALVRENPRLSVYVHERGAPHMADPAKLISSAARLYGDQLEPLYGQFLPVPRERLRVLQGGESVPFGNGRLEVLYSPGHASHHVTYFDPDSRVAFVGDSAGISVEGDSYLLPATPPPDIDMPLWNHTIDATLALRPAKLFLTHFGYSGDPEDHLTRYREKLGAWTATIRGLLREHADEGAAGQAFVAAATREIDRAFSPEDAAHYVFNGGLLLSYLGIARYIRKSGLAGSAAEEVR